MALLIVLCSQHGGLSRSQKVRWKDFGPCLWLQDVLGQSAARAKVVQLKVIEVSLRQVVHRFNFMDSSARLEAWLA